MTFAPKDRLVHCLALFVLCGTAQAADGFSARIEADQPYTLRASDAQPHPGGRLRVILQSREPAPHPWQAVFDEAGTMLARAPIKAFPTRHHGGQSTQFAHHGGGLEIAVPLHAYSCTRERGWLEPGSDLRRFDSSVSPMFDFFGTRIGGLDAGGGHFGSYFVDDDIDDAFVARFARDCSRTVVLQGGIAQLQNVPNAQAAYGFRDGELVRIEIGGEAWSRPMAAPEGLTRLLAGVTVDGLAIVQFHDASQAAKLAVAIDAAGNERWRLALDIEGELQVASDPGVTYLWTTRFPYQAPGLEQHVLRAIAHDGTLRWQHGLGIAPLRELPRLGGDLPTTWSLQQAAPDDTMHEVLEARTDGAQTLLLTAHRPVARWASGNLAALGPWEEIGAKDLRVIALPGGDERVIPFVAPGRITLDALAADEIGTIVATHRSNLQATLTHYDVGGGKRWQIDLPPLPEAFPPELAQEGPIMRMDATRACLLWISQVACVRRGDGTLAHDWTLLPGEVRGTALLALRDGRTDAIGIACDRQPEDYCLYRTALVTIEADGHAQPPLDLGPRTDGSRVAEGPDGDFGFVAWEGLQPRITVRDAMRQQRWTQDAAEDDALVALGAGGTAYVANVRDLRKHAPDGSVAWTLPWPEGIDEHATSAFELPDGDLIVSTGVPHHRFRLRGRDGSVVWHHVGDANGWYNLDGFRWVLSRDGKRVFRLPGAPYAELSAWESGLRVVAIDVATGELLAAQALPETPAWSSTRQLRAAVTSDGRLLRAVEDKAGGVIVRGSVDDLAAPASLPVDASLLGAWRSRDTGGQGLFLDADAGRAYGAWFTYSEEGGHVAEALRWYTLVQSGPIDDGAARFTVHANLDGAFAAPPVSRSAVVGQATLRRVHCDRAMLVYRLDDGAEGVVPLERARESSRLCGTGEVPVGALGFDARSSGAWHDPALPGQGLAFDLGPPAGGSGFFAGAWFTFAPAGGTQHWFTLAGTFEPAPDGRFEVPIFRTMGGRFDAMPTSNTERVGTARLRFSACERLTLDYAFDDTDVAQAFRGRQGRLELQRITACVD